MLLTSVLVFESQLSDVLLPDEEATGYAYMYRVQSIIIN